MGTFDLRRFALQCNLMNTINGGVVDTFVDVDQNENEIVINIKAPGVHPASYNIVLNNNTLFVYALSQQSNGQWQIGEKDEIFGLPLFNRVFSIPPFVDAGKINAEANENRLKVYMPFKDKNEIRPRKIDIRKK